jgi:hypothetical protein
MEWYNGPYETVPETRKPRHKRWQQHSSSPESNDDDGDDDDGDDEEEQEESVYVKPTQKCQERPLRYIITVVPLNFIY